MPKIRVLSFLAAFCACQVPAQAQVASPISGTIRDASLAAAAGAQGDPAIPAGARIVVVFRGMAVPAMTDLSLC